MTDDVSSDIASPEPARDFDGLYKALLEAHPRDALHLLCGARLDGQAVVLDGPTEQPRQRSRQRDKVFLVRHSDGVPADIYHFEVQVKRTVDFQERMVAYWASLALKYGRSDHRIHQVVLWPLGGGFPGRFRRDQAQLDYRSVNVPDDLDPARSWPAPWRRSRCGPRNHRPTSRNGSPIGSPQPARSRSNWSRSSWVCSWEVHWQPRFSKHCEGEA
jgi:hypothetical protein